jgi:diguanylate cyclase (GGDEF)-like protein
MSQHETPRSRDGDEGLETEEQAAEDRDRIADHRDQASEAHEKAAEARDDRAEARDDRAEARDDRAEARDDTADNGDRSVDELVAGVAADRAEAMRDRRGAARDRAHAASDREAAWSDRAVAAGERVVSSIDALTGLHRRDAGIMELEREMARAKRTKKPFVVAFVDVDGLKAKNDMLGHAAGDHLLRQVADSLRAHLRAYDLIVRFGGDEFACGLFDLEIEEVAKRFVEVNADLAKNQQASVTVGLAKLEDGDSLENLIDRADAELYKQRDQRPRSSS